MKKYRMYLILIGLLVVVGISVVFANGNLQGLMTNIKNLKIQRTFSANQYKNDYSQIANSLGLQLLKSAYFTNDPEADKIMKGTPYDLDKLGLLTGITNIDKSIYAYKIFSAFKMLGYVTDRGYWDNNNKPHIIILNAFQQKYGFPISNFVDKNVLLKIDELLAKREVTDKYYADKFLMTSHIGKLNKNDISKNHEAMLFYMPFSVIPQSIQPKTVTQYLYCYDMQCDDKVEFQNGGYPDMPGDYVVFDPHLQNVPFSSLPNDMVKVQATLHEYAHFIDNAVYGKDPTTGSGLIDTRGFYNISFKDVDKITSMPFYDSNCFDRRTNNDNDFISKYALSHGVNHPEGCGPEKYAVAEDFAESFAYYVRNGKDFKAAAAQNPVLAQKYAWLKANVFNGIEYNTDLVGPMSSGCTDGPYSSQSGQGYIKCNEDYVWDGTLPKL